MADRTSAALFGELFEWCADADIGERARKKLAAQLWSMSRGYDFDDCQMDCDDALVELGLARRGIDEDDRCYCEVMLYGPAEVSP